VWHEKNSPPGPNADDNLGNVNVYMAGSEILWMKVDRKMKALGSYKRVWKLGKRGYIWIVGPQCHLIVPVTIVALEREL
jgi:hypothetical protein